MIDIDIITELVNLISDITKGLCRGEYRFYERELITIGHERLVSKKHKYVLQNGTLTFIRPGIEYDNPICCWRNVYDNMPYFSPVKIYKGVVICNSGTIIISATENWTNSWYYKRSKSESIHIDFTAAMYKFCPNEMTHLMDDFINSLSKTKRKSLLKIFVKFSDDKLKLFRKLSRILKIEFPVYIDGKYTHLSYYGLENVPTKESERDRIIGDLIRSKRIIE